jgi:hypothetical protein
MSVTSGRVEQKPDDLRNQIYCGPLDSRIRKTHAMRAKFQTAAFESILLRDCHQRSDRKARLLIIFPLSVF